MKISLNLSPVFIKIILTTICCLIMKTWTESCVKRIHVPSGEEYQFYTEELSEHLLDGVNCSWNFTTEQHYEIILSCDPEEYKENVKSEVYLYISKTDNMKNAAIYEPPFTVNAAKLYVKKNSTGIDPESYYCTIKSEQLTKPLSTCGYIPETCCQKREIPESEEIVGDRIARKHEFPSIVLVCEEGKKIFHCGGTIIASKVILTAAHCVEYQKKPTDYYIIAGAYNISKYNKDRAEQKRYGVSDFKIHDNYGDEAENDIALLITTITIRFSAYIGPACLPFNLQKNAIIGANVIAPGWGATSKKEVSIVPKKVTLTILPDTTCARYYSSYNSQTQLCTQSQGLMNTCKGDSGGPIYLIHEERYYVVGITSAGVSCDVKYANRDVNVINYGHWIRSSVPWAMFC